MENINLLPENEYKEVENRRYINPTLVPTETEDFITRFRDTQKGNNQEIISQTQALGTNVPSNIGGLTGAGSYFTSRYQTPQTNTVTQNLRTAAQQTALNEALANEQAMWKKRYQDAYNAYQKRQNDKDNKDNKDNTAEGGKETQDTTMTIEGVVPGTPEGYTVAMPDTERGTVLGYNYVPYGEEGKTNYYASTQQNYTKVEPTLVSVPRYEIGIKTSNGQELWTNADNSIVRGDDGKYYARNKQNGNVTYLGG